MSNKTIWIDLDNSPHVPFFSPIIQVLEEKGYKVILTARDCFQVCGLAKKFHLKYTQVGKHYGSNIFLKVVGTLWRSLQLIPHVVFNRPALSVSHGSRSQLILSHVIRIPSILIFDYEHVARIPIFKPFLGVAPDMIDGSKLQNSFKMGLVSYPGLKEDVYVSSYKPDPDFLSELNLNSQDMLVTIRPPATEAHYHNPEAEPLFTEVVEYLGSFDDIKMVILPRNEITQRQLIIQQWGEWIDSGKIIVPDKVINGLDMIWYSDFVVSGGGTMNREAAALNVPVYSIFRGKMGAVDKYLSQEGRLKFIEKVADVQNKIKIEKRVKTDPSSIEERPALATIVSTIENTINKIR